MKDDIETLESPTFLISGDIEKAIKYCNSHKDFKLFDYDTVLFNGQTVLNVGLETSNGFLELETIYRQLGAFKPVGDWPDIYYELKINQFLS